MKRNPEKVFRIGNVSASVFARKIEREGEPDLIIRSVNLQKRYVENDETKFSSSFGLAELPQAIAALRLAFNHVANEEAEVSRKE